MNFFRYKTQLLVLLFSTSAIAVQAENWLITEDDLFAEIDFVSGVTHLKQDLQQVPAAVTIIDRRTIESSPAVDLVDLFRFVPGFQVYFHHANKPGVSYHAHGGEYSRRLEVKIDGRSVYEPILSSVEWNTLGIDLDDIDYIEVVRGSNTSADGSNAFLASINIVTRSPLADLGTEYNVNYGTQGFKRGTISHSSQVGRLTSRATIKVSENDGFSGIDDAAETLTMRYQGLWTPTVKDSINFQIGIGDTDTTIGPSDYYERQWDTQYQHVAWKRVTNDWSDVEFSIYHNSINFVDTEQTIRVSDVLYYWGADENGESVAGDVVLTPETQLLMLSEGDYERYIVHPSYAHYSDRWDAELRTNIYRANNLRMSLGLASRYDSLRSELFLSKQGKVSENSNRLYANLEWTVSDELVLNYGQVLKKRRHKASKNSYRVAANYEFSPQHNFRIASSQSYRQPTLLEANQNSSYYYDDIVINTRVIADEDIAKERLISREVGYLGSYLNNNISLDVRIFEEHLFDIIGERREPFAGETQNTIHIIDNVENLDLRGIEWQLQYKPSNRFMVNFNHSYTNVEGESWYLSSTPDDDVATPGVDEIKSIETLIPKQITSLLLSYQLENGVTLSGSHHYQSGYKPRLDDNSAKPSSTSRIDLKASKRWLMGSNWLELSFTVQNAGSDYSEHFAFNTFESKYLLGFKIGSN
jgi:iron complex outermembrane receptor protein